MRARKAGCAMRNVGRIFAAEFRRLFMNVASVIITILLIFMPSIFAWYNILACWDVFDNTGNLKVAVASEDVGYKGELFPVTITIGEQVVSGLRGNEDFDWVVTTSEDALEGARSGKYYAAVIIPETFSEDLLGYCFGGDEQATIVYLSNEKISAIAPKLTDQGADAVSNTINTVLVQSVTEVMLSAVDSVWTYAQDKDLDEHIQALPADLRLVQGRVDSLSSTLAGYSRLVRDTAQLASSAATLAASLGDGLEDAEGVTSDLQASAATLAAGLRTTMEETITSLDADIAAIPGMDAEMASGLAQARSDVRAALTQYRQTLQPAIDALNEDLAALSASSDASLEAYADACYRLSGRLSGLAGELSETGDQLDEAIARLDGTSAMLGRAADKIEEALGSDDVETLRDILNGDIEMISAALAEPVGIERIAIYPVENFGSAMAPLYSALALFIGALLIMVFVKPHSSDEVRARLTRPRTWQEYLGHYGVVLALATAQSVVMALGNMFFLGVQALHPWLYLLCFWVASATFSFIIYTLVFMFANLGKAIAVLLLIMQVTGCGGSYPLPLLPDFVNAISPYLPATHVVNAMRAAMMGTYAGDFWLALGALVAFTVPFMIAGLLLSRPCEKLVDAYLARVEASKLMN